jgi:hypothetical protein
MSINWAIQAREYVEHNVPKYVSDAEKARLGSAYLAGVLVGIDAKRGIPPSAYNDTNEYQQVQRDIGRAP